MRSLKKPARPPRLREPRDHRMSISLTATAHRALREMGDLDGKGMAWHVNRAIEDMITRETDRMVPVAAAEVF